VVVLFEVLYKIATDIHAFSEMRKIIAYLEPVYDCPDCKDTGYIDSEDGLRKKCHCFHQQSGKRLVITVQ